jgi:hypothetical protein
MHSFKLLNIFFTISLLQTFQLLQQHGTHQQVNACLCSDQGTLNERLDRAEWGKFKLWVDHTNTGFCNMLKIQLKNVALAIFVLIWEHFFLPLLNNNNIYYINHKPISRD